MLAENPDFLKGLTLAEEDYRNSKRTGPMTIKVHYLDGQAKSVSFELQKKLDADTQLIQARKLVL